MEGAKVKLEEVQKQLQEVYGEVSVDIQTGDVKEKEVDTEN